MKKIIFALSALALLASCSQTRKWTDTEREGIRKMVRDHRDRSAIRHMEAANYQNLEECAVTTIEGAYPDYNKFDKLTGKTDTLDAVVINCIGYSIGPNFENLPLLFPYNQLVKAGMLPANLSEDQQKAFYMCLMGKVQQLYKTPDQFTVAMFDEPDVPMEMADVMQQCAASVAPADSTMNPAAPKK